MDDYSLDSQNIFLDWFFFDLAIACGCYCSIWVAKQATPGKIVITAKVVDAKTSSASSAGQLIIRHIAYFISLLQIGLLAFLLSLLP